MTGNFLAGESEAADRVGHQLAVEVVERQGPEARRRRDAREYQIASPVERAAIVVGRGGKRDAVAERGRQSSDARNRGLRVRVGVGGAGFRPGRPAADRQWAEGGAAGE